MGHAGAVANDVETGRAGLKSVVNLDLHVVELDLHTVKQGIVIGGAGGDLVKGVNHLNDAVKDALGNYQTQIAGGGRQRRGDKAFPDTGLGAAPSAYQVAEALHDDAAAEHVGKAGNALTVASS